MTSEQPTLRTPTINDLSEEEVQRQVESDPLAQAVTAPAGSEDAGAPAQPALRDAVADASYSYHEALMTYEGALATRDTAKLMHAGTALHEAALRLSSAQSALVAARSFPPVAVNFADLLRDPTQQLDVTGAVTRSVIDHLTAARATATSDGSEDAGLVLSEHALINVVAEYLCASWSDDGGLGCAAEPSCFGHYIEAADLLAARVEAALAKERERIAAAIDAAPGFRRWIDDSRVVDKDVAIRIARTPPPAGDDERGGA